MVDVIERTEGHYEVQDVELGRVYRWCPERVVVRCECGEKVALTASTTVCGCGADHAAVVREGLAGRRRGDEAVRPWRYAGDRDNVGLPF